MTKKTNNISPKMVKAYLQSTVETFSSKDCRYFSPDTAIQSRSLGRSGCAYRWIVDPIDGTTNFAHGFPYFSVSIALEIGCQPAVGVVYDPMHDELFYATKDGGAYLNKKKIRVSKTKDMKKSLLCTGFAYEIKDARDSNVEHFVDFLMTAQAIRRMGSAALDLCYVACGRFDGFWEIGLKPWDTAAAILIVTEAGGKLSRFNGTKYSHYDQEILATNGLIHVQMSKILVRRLKDFHCRVVFDKY